MSKINTKKLKDQKVFFFYKIIKLNIRKLYIRIVEKRYIYKKFYLFVLIKKTKENYFSTILFLVFKKLEKLLISIFANLEISIFGKFFLIFLYYYKSYSSFWDLPQNLDDHLLGISNKILEFLQIDLYPNACELSNYFLIAKFLQSLGFETSSSCFTETMCCSKDLLY